MGQGLVFEGSRREISRALRQLGRVWPTLAVGSAAVLLALAFIRTLSAYQGVPAEYLTGDPTAMFDAPWWVGFLSNLGIMLWAAAAGICILGAFLLRGVPAERRAVPFLTASAAGCLALALDDAYRMHEDVFPAHLGISERAIGAMYAASALAYLAYFRRLLRDTDYLVLLTALGSLAGSVFLDLFFFEALLEDALKFAGIVFWLLYHARTVALLVREGLGGSRTPAGRLSRARRL